MIIIPDSNNSITLIPKNVAEEIIQNIKVIVTTVMGNVPLDRKFGIDSKIIDNPIKAKSRLAIFILESIQDFEPRAEVTNIEIIEDIEGFGKGRLMPKLEVNIKDEYIS